MIEGMTTAEVIAVAASVVSLIGVAAAWSAIFANRRNATDTMQTQINIAARNSRATVVSANRQKWIDAIRDDVADFISTRSQLSALTSAGSFERAGQDALLTEQRALQTKLVMLQARIDMRLNHTESDHRELLNALSLYDQQFSEELDISLRVVGRKIFKDEWTRLQKEASGIDPFVRDVATRS
jgi:gluconate kinase